MNIKKLLIVPALLFLPALAIAAPTVEELAKIIAVQQAVIESLRPVKGSISAFHLTQCPKGWIAADGTNGTPDLRGVFLRAANNFGSAAGSRKDEFADPDNRQIGSTQKFGTSAKGLSNSASVVTGNVRGTTGINNQDHSHGWNANNIKLQGIARFTGNGHLSSFGLESGPAEATGGESQKHTHSFSAIISDGSAAAQTITSSTSETRPSNVAVIYCIYK